MRNFNYTSKSRRVDRNNNFVYNYKYNKKIGNVTCTPDKPSAIKKIKEIARKDYGYYGH